MKQGLTLTAEERATERLAAAEQEVEHLQLALQHRTTIGQAQGILMERLSISSDSAFTYLRRVSSQSNTKLILIAADIVQTGELPT